MSKTVTFDSLPREIGTTLSDLDSPECFSIEAFRHEAITVVNKNLSLVYKFVRNNKKLVLQLDKEVNNLTQLRNRKISVPAVLSRQLLMQYDMVTFSYVEGEIVEGDVRPVHAKLLAQAHRNLHLSFEQEGKNEFVEWNSARILKPIFSKTNASKYAPDLVRYARSIAQALKSHELARDDVTLIHSDSHFSNVVFQSEQAVLIDWAEAGWASKYFELGVTIHSMLYEKKSMQRDLILAYLNEYFEGADITERDVQLIDLHTKLRFLEGATWHLLESKEDQLRNKEGYAKFVQECWRKAERFNLTKLLGTTEAR
jgi:Ser/Thr protein kinase RdoA (MazF antagonist)